MTRIIAELLIIVTTVKGIPPLCHLCMACRKDENSCKNWICTSGAVCCKDKKDVFVCVCSVMCTSWLPSLLLK